METIAAKPHVAALGGNNRLMPVAGRELPLSMMASGLNGLVWYLFAALYLVGTWRLTRHPALRLLDGAVVETLLVNWRNSCPCRKGWAAWVSNPPRVT